jgi:hypothetical protein
MHQWHLSGIDHRPFEQLFALSDQQLAEIGAVRRIATESPGFPCRISLEDAQVGEELLLLPYQHHPSASPYRATGPIFVRRGSQRRVLGAGELPAYVSSRLISVRAYDAAAFMVDASVCEGTAVAAELDRVFSNAEVVYVHLHNARQGCFSCQVSRAAANAGA